MNKTFIFEIEAYKTITVDGFPNKQMARQWLINNLEEQCYDIVNASTIVSDGNELSGEKKE